MSAGDRRVARAVLERFAAAVLAHAGMPETTAEIVAAHMVGTDARGMQSHGTDLLPSYYRGLVEGHLDAAAEPEVVRHAGSIAVIDGHNALGHVVSDLAMKQAIEMAGAHGLGVVVARGSNHFGAAGSWPLMAVRCNMIGFATTNGPAGMAPWGGAEAAICNNPFAWGIPAGEERAILLDMALTQGARGRLRLARQRGEQVPEGWALGPDGRPTTDPVEALAGVMLPLGGHKGSGIAVVNELLGGALSGARLLSAVDRRTMSSVGYHPSWQIGHFFLVLDPAAVRELDDFLADVDHVVRELHATRPAAGFDVVRLPGEGGLGRAEVAEREGVLLGAASWEKLVALESETGVGGLTDAVAA